MCWQVVLAALFYSDVLSNHIETLSSRIANSRIDADDTLAGRGYDRIWNNAEYIIFGAGEGAVYRFDTFLGGEIHSSVGTLLFSYGILGLLLFLYALGRLGIQDRVCIKYILVILIYGLAHQGLRSTHFWIFLGLVSAFHSPALQGGLGRSGMFDGNRAGQRRLRRIRV